MAKEGIKAREVKRERLVARYASKRAQLKAAGDYAGLDKLPKNSSAVRLHNRCKITGRPRGYLRQFGISRVLFREMALNGKIIFYLCRPKKYHFFCFKLQNKG
jgi:small subunit ribosomal protein S14